jgi:LPS sulfotransferase NodH
MEYWNADYRGYFLNRWGCHGEASDYEYLRLALRAGTTANGVFGAKIHWYQFERLSLDIPEPRDLPFFAAVPEIRYVFLTRADKLRQSISWYRASKTNEWSSVEANRRNGANRPQPHFCYHSILRGITILEQHEQAWHNFFNRAGIDPLALEYSEVCADVVSATRRVLRFLCLPHAESVPIHQSRLEQQRDGLTEQWAHAWITERRRNHVHADPHFGPDCQDPMRNQ